MAEDPDDGSRVARGEDTQRVGQSRVFRALDDGRQIFDECIVREMTVGIDHGWDATGPLEILR